MYDTHAANTLNDTKKSTPPPAKNTIIVMIYAHIISNNIAKYGVFHLECNFPKRVHCGNVPKNYININMTHTECKCTAK